MEEKILIGICCLIIGYLFGSISTAVILSKKIYKQDIRELGSKNSGATNMGRIFGLKVGFIIIILDMLKTCLPIWISYFVLKYTPLSQFNMAFYGYLISGLGAVIGHCFPLFYGFKGGKAVSSFGGFIVATCWFLIPIGLCFYLLLLKIQKTVSLTSIILSIVLSCLSFLLPLLPSWFMNFEMESGIAYSITLCLIALILVIRHKDNIKRIIEGNERKIKWMK